MKINYLLPPDDDLRAKAVARAVFEDFNTEIGDYKGEVTLTISDKNPAFIVFSGEQTKHPVIGWRLAAKQFSEAIFGVKCNVVKVGAKAEEYYLKAAANKEKESIQKLAQVIEDKAVKKEEIYSKAKY